MSILQKYMGLQKSHQGGGMISLSGPWTTCVTVLVIGWGVSVNGRTSFDYFNTGCTRYRYMYFDTKRRHLMHLTMSARRRWYHSISMCQRTSQYLKHWRARIWCLVFTPFLRPMYKCRSTKCVYTCTIQVDNANHLHLGSIM